MSLIEEVTLECPVCGYDMSSKIDTFTGPTGKQYDRVKFNCKRDDTWGEIEIPIAETTEDEA